MHAYRIDGLGIGKVIRSDNPMYKRDDVVHGMIGMSAITSFKTSPSANYILGSIRAIFHLQRRRWISELAVANT